MSRTAVLFRTHRFSPGIFSEFAKLSAGAAKTGADAFILLDNDKLPLQEPGDNDRVVEREIDGHRLPVFSVGHSQFEALGLPLLSHEAQPSRGGIKWCNGDYPLYVFFQAVSGYDWYWMLDYDVFFNGADYEPFFTRYADCAADFLSRGFSPAPPDWMWARNTDWAYAPEEKRFAFFPAVRFSARSLPPLLERRREMGARYAAAAGEKQWLGVELFVPTELDRLGFSHALLDNLGTFHCRESLDLGEDRFFERPDNKLYHPVKGDFVSRLRRSEKRVAELEREVSVLRAQNAALMAAQNRHTSR